MSKPQFAAHAIDSQMAAAYYSRQARKAYERGDLEVCALYQAMAADSYRSARSALAGLHAWEALKQRPAK